MNLNSSISSMDLANTIDSTHDKLVEMAAEEQIWLKTEGYKKDIPYEFATFITDLKMLAHILYRCSSDLLHTIEESLQRIESSFLGHIAGVHLGESLRLTVGILCVYVLALLILLDYLLQFSHDDCIFLPNEMQGQLTLNIEEVLS